MTSTKIIFAVAILTNAYAIFSLGQLYGMRTVSEIYAPGFLSPVETWRGVVSWGLLVLSLAGMIFL